MILHTLTDEQLTSMLNNAKELLIARLNEEHDLKLDPNEYVFCFRRRGVFGKLFDRLWPSGDDDSRVTLMRLNKMRALPESPEA